MGTSAPERRPRAGSEELERRRQVVSRELHARTLWFIRLRWIVPPAIGCGALIGRAIGFEVPLAGLLGAALFVLVYNVALFLLRGRVDPAREPALRRFTLLQVALDYLTVFALLHFTGGISSPLTYIALFHIIYAAILLSRASAYALAAALTIGLVALTAAELGGWLTHYSLRLANDEPRLAFLPNHAAVAVLFFSLAAFITAYSTTSITTMLRQRIGDLADLAEENERKGDALERAGAERARFMRQLAHNLRAPLVAVITMLDLLRREHLGPVNDKQSEYLRRSDRRLRTMADMISELVTLAARRNGGPPLQPVPIAVEELARRVQRSFGDTAAERGVELELALEGELPPVLGELPLLEQTMDNLVGNAVKYTPSGGHIDVRFRAADADRIAIDVRDTGIGIPADDLPRVFDELFRAPNARAFEEIGTGLGLAIVKDFVERLGGSLSLESTEGVGTSVTVTLPAAREEEK